MYNTCNITLNQKNSPKKKEKIISYSAWNDSSILQVEAQWPPPQPTKTSRLHGDDDEDDDEDGGGINIEKAKKFMEEEDKHDKRLFKERIKAKHLVRHYINPFSSILGNLVDVLHAPC